MNDTPDPALAAPMAALRAGLAAHLAPPAVEKELMAAFARQYPRQRWYRALSPAQWGVAGGVGSGALAVLLFMLVLQAPQRSGVAPPALIGRDNGVAFIALESLERIEQESAPQLVETDIPRIALAPLGVPVSPENAGESVRAEMLVGADGAPLALRLSSTQP
ncbi:MAG: hypothetical protein V4508_00545 [Pseudomonadota bacterium]